MTLQQSRRLQSLLLGTLAWAIAILIFFPIFWMVLTSFKTEIDAFATPPQFIFTPTLENYLHINERTQLLQLRVELGADFVQAPPPCAC